MEIIPSFCAETQRVVKKNKINIKMVYVFENVFIRVNVFANLKFCYNFLFIIALFRIIINYI